MYTIYKDGKMPRERSYKGKAWDEVGIRDRYKAVYEDKKEAAVCAALLSTYTKHNFSIFYLGEW